MDFGIARVAGLKERSLGFRVRHIAGSRNDRVSNIIEVLERDMPVARNPDWILLTVNGFFLTAANRLGNSFLVTAI